MNKAFNVIYKRGNLVWASDMDDLDIVGMVNKGVYEIVAVRDNALDETLQDLRLSYDHNDNDYFLAIFDNEDGMILKDFPLTLTSFEYIYDRVKAGEMTIIAWINAR